MTLTNRLNFFFLTALAIVLAGFSIAIFLLARLYLYRQADERLESAISVLTAAVEITPYGVEWEPSERQMSFGSGDAVVWVVVDPEGQVVAGDGPAETPGLLVDIAASLHAAHQERSLFERGGKHWQFRQHWVEAPNHLTAVVQPPGDPEKKYLALGIMVGVSLDQARDTLRELAIALCGLSLTILLAGLIAGRFVCRRALRPVIEMASAAHDIDAAALDRRLPLQSSRDELEDLARAFNALLERVQLAFERQRRFTGDASHQLRTPLAALIGQVEVALRRERPEEEYRRVLGSVRQQADRLQRIVEALLFLARAEAEAQLPLRERLDLATWLPEYVQTWQEHPRHRDLVMRTTSATVRAHSVLLGELISILIDNAFKYSPAGSQVAVEVGVADVRVEIAVQDRGEGIAPEDLPHLFEPFFRTPAARLKGVEGHGLGLAVAKRIAEAFGGELTARSEKGEGSRFSLMLAIGT